MSQGEWEAIIRFGKPSVALTNLGEEDIYKYVLWNNRGKENNPLN